MKNITFLLIVLSCIGAVGCKKSETNQGSPYTKLVAGTRSYSLTSTTYLGGTPTVTTDTVSLIIDYIDDATIELKTSKFLYSNKLSTDSILFYDDGESSNTNSDASITFDLRTNSIQYTVSNFVTSVSGGKAVYTSL